MFPLYTTEGAINSVKGTLFIHPFYALIVWWEKKKCIHVGSPVSLQFCFVHKKAAMVRFSLLNVCMKWFWRDMSQDCDQNEHLVLLCQAVYSLCSVVVVCHNLFSVNVIHVETLFYPRYCFFSKDSSPFLYGKELPYYVDTKFMSHWIGTCNWALMMFLQNARIFVNIE